jgi:hypothetical protein
MAVQAALAVVGVAMGALNMYSQGQQAKANNRVRKAQADAENTLRPAKNQAAAAQSSLALWSQSINNQRRARGIGGQVEAGAVNQLRGKDQAVSQTFVSSIRNAEQAGAQAAASASSGVSGNVVDMVAGATALRRRIGEESAARTVGMMDSDFARRTAELSSQLVSGLDMSTTMAGMDYNQTVMQQQHAVSGAEIAITAAAQLGAQLYTPSTNPRPALESSMSMGLGEQGGNIGRGFWGSSSRGLLLGGTE